MNIQAIQKIKTLIRVRPLLPFENEPAWTVQANQIQCLHTKSVVNKIDKDARRSKYEIQNYFKQLTMHFQQIASQKVSSQKLYKQYIRNELQQCLQDNKNMTLMCYGQTCSGKTYTILGEQKSPGLMPCLLRELILFTSNKENKLTFSIELSYFQLYNECIYDLLNENHKYQQKEKQAKLKLYEDKIYGWQVEGLKKYKVETFEQCVKIIQKGQKNRSYRSKQNHQRSSRSHTLMRIYIQVWDKNFMKKQQHINIVDLAGSERLSTISPNINQAQTASINKSLFQLSNVINKLSTQQENIHIPYRNSKLTKLLQKSLSSIQNKCLIIFCISPSINCFNQSISTLRLAQKAKRVIVKPQIPEILNIEDKYQKEFLKTKRKLKQKQQQCEFLNKKLQVLMEEVKQLQNKINKQNKFTAKANLIVLLDHQNFIIQNLMKSQSFKSNSSFNQQKFNQKLQHVKQIFLKNMQQIYEQYSTNVIHQYIRASSDFNIDQSQDVLIKLEQICFMNIVYDSSRLVQHKIEVIQNILKDLKNSKQQNQSNNKNISFILTQYLNTLKQSQIKNSSSIINNFKDKSNVKQLSYQIQKFHYQPKLQIQRIQKLQQKSIGLSKLYSWGCLKDNRVCKGKNILAGIVSASLPQDIKIIELACGFNHSLFVTEKGEVYGWGKNNQYQISSKKQLSLSIPKKINFYQKIRNVSAGWSHSMCLTQDGAVYSWGCGKDGQLGHGINQSQKNPRRIQIKNKIIKIYCGHSNSAIISEYYQFYIIIKHQFQTIQQK